MKVEGDYMKQEKLISYFLNEPQQKTLELIKKYTKGAHFINLNIRYNGEDKIMEADFLREIIKQL
jgi:hypothetical protein